LLAVNIMLRILKVIIVGVYLTPRHFDNLTRLARRLYSTSQSIMERELS
jgi:hypothetical protein